MAEYQSKQWARKMKMKKATLLSLVLSLCSTRPSSPKMCIRDSHDDFHPRFLEALTQLDQVEDQMDTLLSGTLSEKQEVIRDFLREQKKRMKEAIDMEPKNLTPVYRESSAYAREHGELESFRLSHQANLDCKRAIQDAISRYFDGWSLDKKAALEILEQFGMERTTLVLAATVQDLSLIHI